MKPPAFVILGMHRSGTSLLAALACAAGADPPNALEPADEYNEKGYWEPAGLHVLHDCLLHEYGDDWDTLFPYRADLTGSAIAAEYRHQIAALMREQYAGARLPCIKEPRISRLLPLWIPLLDELGFDPRFAIVARNPLEVAESLQRRNGFLVSQSLVLWLRYTMEAEGNSRGQRRVFVTYEQLTREPADAIARIGASLGIEWPLPPAEVERRVAGFADETLRHHRAEDADLETREDVSEWIVRAYRACCAAAEGREATALAEFDRVRGEMTAADRALRPVFDAYGAVLASARDEEIAWLRGRLADRGDR